MLLRKISSFIRSFNINFDKLYPDVSNGTSQRLAKNFTYVGTIEPVCQRIFKPLQMGLSRADVRSEATDNLMDYRGSGSTVGTGWSLVNKSQTPQFVSPKAGVKSLDDIPLSKKHNV